MKQVCRQIILILALSIGLSAAAFAAPAKAAGTVKNATVKKQGTYYIGYKENGKKIKNKWGIVKDAKKSYTYYFDKKGRAYTGVHAIGKTPADTKLYFFNAKGRLNSAKTKKLQKYSGAGKKFATLKAYIKKIDKKNICKKSDACGMTMCQFRNGFTIYMDYNNPKNVGYILVD